MRSIWNGAISFGLVTIPGQALFWRRRRRTSPSTRFTPRTAGVSACAASARSTARKFPTRRSSRATSSPAAKWSSSTTTIWRSCRSPVRASSTCSSSSRSGAGRPDLLLPAATTWSPTSQRPRPTGSCVRRSSAPGQGALVKIALRQRESLATLRVRDGVLVLEMMLWPDEIRKAAFEFLGRSRSSGRRSWGWPAR